ncbi:hypothetical protein AtubIFM55763_002980 [Aspergillus tubingensis]|uniref:Uncharacterized protein n=3 Tax=Aspergillus subgen. Circumdati TaxID=2720871 RepID=A0A8H3SW83_ASPTU|nr:hypothetical protein BO87DRAFT_373898 [Aspergillus neoniger CBS 115656]XP_035357931.1 uncharacterized protein AtWU_06929 [Aspergillus tubingensis]GAQ42469.1 similar to An11g06870 [Aspergillus niger]PYH37549.1 hypothetical protein BO87DRAFT_373898 [Aspergillus neoniger CBS 115656]GFN17127.1 hypothetical protein AtWU_06929 [Aspergillus tubingensis]GLA57853.1 hypothetical protein AtubIFM54640_005648 [Aspergillus tubingensis]GLA72441.1 hypothetical protein AtubIFM55763_002980 [Aspergillus tubi
MPAFLKNIKNKLKAIFKKKKTAEENPEGAAAPAENTPAADKPAEQAQTEGGVSAAPPTLEVTESPAGEAKPETEAHAEAAAGASDAAAKPAETAGDAADKETK